MSFGHFALHQVGQSLDDALGKRCPIMAPPPDGHAADPEISSGFAVGPEDDLEDEIVPATGDPALEAERRCYGLRTKWHVDQLG